MTSPDTSAAEVVGRLRHLISLNEPRNGGPYAGIAAEACMKAMADAITTIDTSRAETAAANARAEALERALTPNADTKAAYSGEFRFDHVVWDHDGEFEVTHHITVPWTTIKEIMQAVRFNSLPEFEPTPADRARRVLAEIEGKSK